jgi:hypothetical protein
MHALRRAPRKWWTGRKPAGEGRCSTTWAAPSPPAPSKRRAADPVARAAPRGSQGSPPASHAKASRRSGLRRVQGPSCRKNKAQRCSVCGGIGHKSRTCSVVQQQQQLQQAQQQAAATAATNLHLQQVQPAGMPMQVPMFATGCALPPGAYPSMCAMAPAAQPGLAAQPVASVPPAAVAAPPTAVAPPPAAVAAPPPPAESAAPPEEPKIEQPAVAEPQAAS